MSLTVANVLATPISILDDPSGLYWSATGDLIPYLNSFIFDVCGLRRDLYSIRAVVNLTSGSYQTLPSGGLQLLDVYWAGNGQAVFLKNIADVKETKFTAGGAASPQVQNVQVATVDPRDRKSFRVFPPSTGTSSTLDILYGAVPSPVAATSDAYPLDPDTVGGSQYYVLASAYEKHTERRDVVKSAAYWKRYTDWVQENFRAEVDDSPAPD